MHAAAWVFLYALVIAVLAWSSVIYANSKHSAATSLAAVGSAAEYTLQSVLQAGADGQNNSLEGVSSIELKSTTDSSTATLTFYPEPLQSGTGVAITKSSAPNVSGTFISTVKPIGAPPLDLVLNNSKDASSNAAFAGKNSMTNVGTAYINGGDKPFLTTASVQVGDFTFADNGYGGVLRVTGPNGFGDWYPSTNDFCGPSVGGCGGACPGGPGWISSNGDVTQGLAGGNCRDC